jgi:hypothetical protein
LLLVLILTPVASWAVAITMSIIGFVFGLVNWFGLFIAVALVAYSVKRQITL